MTKEKGRNREPITESRELEIITLIDEWDPDKGPLTRQALVRRVKCKMGLVFTRQGLMKRERILLAFQRREKEINGDVKPRAEKEPVVVVLEREKEALQAKVNEQAKVIAGFKEMFFTYRYNARQLGITREQLEAPIPPRNQPEGSRG
ncbi:hypothetical protein [Sphingomonas sp.]|uniref:hypothetical protein n=1 Tax=Sphingomonas sp. TaxID=28214 RepID=UPI00181A5BC8|nr:hypothetical protein [Sphingomonas sp.]MBA4761924.1 hypothetical protein [Sphingomonas sp.]